MIEKYYLTEKRIMLILSGMVQRCYNPNRINYPSYGGRGISVCDEWRNDAGSFLKWAKSNGYDEGLVIDRINNDGNYEPDNCRWVTKKVNARNRRNTIYLEYNGDIKPATEIAEIHGVDALRLKGIAELGYTTNEAISMLTSKILNTAGRLRNKREAELKRCKDIIDNYYTFFQLR